MDRFERCLSIFKLTKEEKGGRKQPETLTEDCTESVRAPDPDPRVQILRGERGTHEGGLEVDQTKPAGRKPWRAVRVDLVVSPISQFAFALLGWTGSKVSFQT